MQSSNTKAIEELERCQMGVSRLFDKPTSIGRSYLEKGCISMRRPHAHSTHPPRLVKIPHRRKLRARPDRRKNRNPALITVTGVTMKFSYTAGLLMAATSTHSVSICPKGSQAITVVRTASVNLATIACKGLTDTFGTTSGADDARIYLAKIKGHAECGRPTGCFASCRISVENNLAAALNIILGEKKTICEAAGGSCSTMGSLVTSVLWSGAIIIKPCLA